MPTTLQFRRYDTANIANTTGAVGEIFIDTDKDTVVVNDGSTSGGFPLALEANTTAAHNQANSARLQANNAYAEANLKLNLAGGTITGDLVVSGNLAVQGNTTTLNVEHLQVEDNEILLNYGTTGAPTLNAGIVIDRGNQPHVYLKWVEGANTWGWSDDNAIFITFANLHQSIIYSNAAFSTLNNTFDNANSATANVYAQANLARDQANSARAQANTAYGHANNIYNHANNAYDQANNARNQANTAYGQANAAYADSNTRVLKAGDTMTGNLNVSAWLITQNIVPNANVTYDIGSNELRFKDIWVSNSTIHVGDADISSVGDEIRIPKLNVEILSSASGINVAAQSSDAYGQANTARGTANDAYAQANAGITIGENAYAQANTARGTANGAYAQSNGAYAQANGAYGQANGAYAQANGAYNAANNAKVTVFANSGIANVTTQTINFVNTSTILVSVANTSGNANVTLALIGTPYDQANTARTTANGAYGQANSARDQANTARTTANDAYAGANTANTNALNAYGQANAARDQANTARTQANTARDTANSAYGEANTAETIALNSYGQANAARDQANTARTTANDAYGQANSARDQANTARSDANTTFSTINTTFATLNTSAGSQNTAITNAHNQANSARDQANTAYGQANSARDQANAGYAQANSARNQANSAYAEANLKLNLTGGTLSGDLTVAGNLTVTGSNTLINVSNLSVNDSIILMANGQVGDIYDIGFVGHFDRGATNTHAGFIRKASLNEFYLFDNYEVEPTNNIIDINGQNFRLGNVRVNTINANSVLILGSAAATQANLTLAHNQANSARDQANSARDQANTARTTANDAYGKANTADTNALNSYGQANSARDQANSARAQANTAYGQANAAYTAANNAKVTVFANSGAANATTQTVNFVNTSTILVSVANTSGNANIALSLIGTPYDQANSARNQANTARTTANDAYSGANTANTNALNAYGQANTARTTANDAYGAANNRVLKSGDTMTGSLNFNFSGANSNVTIQNQNDVAALEMGGANGAIIDMKSPNSDDYDLRIQVNNSSNATFDTSAGRTIFFNTANVNFDSGTLFVNATENEVGVGTTNPTSNLHVVGNANITGEITNAGGINTNAMQANTATITLGPGSTDGFSSIVRIQSNTRAMRIYPYYNSEGSDRGTWFSVFDNSTLNSSKFTLSASDIVLDATGNVGIKTNSPTSNLHVVGNANITTTMVVGGLTTTANIIEKTVANTNTNGANNINLNESNFFTRTLTANCQFTFRNAPASGNAQNFTLVVIQDASGARVPSWANTIYWAGGSAPPATTTANARDVWQFVTYDGGSTYFGTLAIKAAS